MESDQQNDLKASRMNSISYKKVSCLYYLQLNRVFKITFLQIQAITRENRLNNDERKVEKKTISIPKLKGKGLYIAFQVKIL